MTNWFKSYSFIIPAIAYFVYDIFLIIQNPAYDWTISIRVFTIMLLLTFILAISLLPWLKGDKFKQSFYKGLRVSYLWNYLVLLITEAFIYIVVH
jgi:hypothetical protein